MFAQQFFQLGSPLQRRLEPTARRPIVMGIFQQIRARLFAFKQCRAAGRPTTNCRRIGPIAAFRHAHFRRRNKPTLFPRPIDRQCLEVAMGFSFVSLRTHESDKINSTRRHQPEPARKPILAKPGVAMKARIPQG